MKLRYKEMLKTIYRKHGIFINFLIVYIVLVTYKILASVQLENKISFNDFVIENFKFYVVTVFIPCVIMEVFKMKLFKRQCNIYIFNWSTIILVSIVGIIILFLLMQLYRLNII